MLRFLKQFLTFLIFTGIFYLVMVPIWGNLIPFEAFKKNLNYRIGSYGHLNTRLKEADTIQNVDVLVVGSSHAYRGFDPRIFSEENISLFVLGSSSQTPIQAKYLLKEYLDKLKPQLVIYEVYPLIFSNDGVESSLDVIANHSLTIDDIKMSLKVNHLKTYNVLINDVFREAFSLNDDFLEPLVTKEDTYINGGYVEKNEFERGVERIGNRRSAYKSLRIQEEAFTDIIGMIKEKGIETLLVQAPITKKLYSSITNNEEFDSYLSNHADYINFNLLLELDDQEHFYDNHHLNQSGV